MTPILEVLASTEQQLSQPPASERPRRDARSVNNARGSSSSVGNYELECSYSLFLAYMISRQGFAHPVDILGMLLLGTIFRTFSYFFRILGAA